MTTDAQDDPDAGLLIADAEARALAIEIETLRARWPVAEPATRRAAIGRRISDACERLADCYQTVITTRARTLAGAAVKLRRAILLLDSISGASNDRAARAAAKLVEDALEVVEKEAAGREAAAA